MIVFPLVSSQGSFEQPRSSQAAQHFYRQFKPMISAETTTDTLASAIFAAVGVYKNYTIRNFEKKPPYKIKDMKSLFEEDLTSILKKFPKYVSLICLVHKRKFRLYLKEVIKNKDVKETKLYRVKSKIKEASLKVSSKDKGYIVFIRSNEVRNFEEEFHPNPNSKHSYYCYHPLLRASIESKNAPFHHEVQFDGLCGLHALNAYMGCHYFSPQTILKYYKKWEENSFTSATANDKLREASDEKSSETSSDKSSDKSSETARKKLTGCDPAFFDYVLGRVVRDRKLHKITVLDSQQDAVTRVALLEDLKRIDRFILGVSGETGHSLTFRQDDRRIWWRIDSLKDCQDSFADVQEVLETLEEEEANQLHFVYVNPEKNVDYCNLLKINSVIEM